MCGAAQGESVDLQSESVDQQTPPCGGGRSQALCLLVWAKLELLCLHDRILYSSLYASFLLVLCSHGACGRDVEGRGEQSGQGSFPVSG